MKGRLLLIDTETGGVEPARHQILSLAALVLNYDGQVIDEMYTLIDEHKRNAPGTLEFTSWRDIEDSALKVNGLTRETVVEQGVSTSFAVGMLTEMLKRHDMLKGVTIVAHNAKFDTEFLRSLYGYARADYDAQFSHRTICTQAAALLMDQAGVIKPKSCSLDGLVEYFEVPLDREGGHNALRDAKATAVVFQKLMLRCREGL